MNEDVMTPLVEREPEQAPIPVPSMHDLMAEIASLKADVAACHATAGDTLAKLLEVVDMVAKFAAEIEPVVESLSKNPLLKMIGLGRV